MGNVAHLPAQPSQSPGPQGVSLSALWVRFCTLGTIWADTPANNFNGLPLRRPHLVPTLKKKLDR